ncbi:MAG: penicillin-binding protein 1C [Gemmatimonadaceae bacterium]
MHSARQSLRPRHSCCGRSTRAISPPASSGLVITDRAGAVLRSSRASDGSRFRWISLNSINPSLPAAFVATEDRGFYSHHGIESRSVLRAARDNILAGRVISGASTITMQAARLIAGLPRGISGKPRQILWALRLEAHLSKQQILEQYLNRVPLGQGAVGVESAAQLYFNASASNLSLGQAAMLAGLAQSPSRDNPIASETRARSRRALALHRLSARNFASKDEIDRANAEPARAVSMISRASVASRSDSASTDARTPMPVLNSPFPAPHFTSWLLSQGDSARDEHPQSQANHTTTIRTTLDLNLQTEVEGEVRHAIQQLSDQQVQHAAAVVLDNATGDVLAWVGSPDFSAPGGQVDMVVSHRQPGSALKPFAYAYAFDHGVTAATVLDDISQSWQTASGPYRPRNYDRREHGPVRAREALASSYNIPAVQLTDRIGVPALLQTLRLAGFAGLTRSVEHYGLGLALGDGDVSLLQMANAYRALGNGGVWHPVRVNADVQISDSAVRVVSAPAAALVLDVLSDPVARIPGFGETTPFDFAFPVAAKTGTSRHFTDNWAVAVTGNFTVAVWVGNFDGHPMAAVSGISGAGPLLRHIVLRVAARNAPGVLPSPASFGATRVRVCRLSGQPAIPECPSIEEWFLPNTYPSNQNWYREGALVLPSRYASWRKHSSEHVGDGERVAVSGNDSELSVSLNSHFPNSELASKSAVLQPNGAALTAGKLSAKLTASLSVDSPRDGDRYDLPSGPETSVATISLRASGRDANTNLMWFVDGKRYLDSRWHLTAGEHLIAVQSQKGARAQARVTVQ